MTAFPPGGLPPPDVDPARRGAAISRLSVVEPWLIGVAAIAVLSALSINALRPMVMYRALALGANPVEIGLLAASFSVLSVAVALPIGRLVDRVGGGRFVIAGMLVVGAMALVSAWAESLVALALAYMVMGLGQTITLVAQQTTVANRGGRAGRDARYGLYTTATSVGQLVGPALAGLLAGGTFFATLGLDVTFSNAQAPVFMMAAIVTSAAALIGIPLARHRERSAPRAAEAGPPVNMVVAAGRVLRRPGMLRAMLVSVTVVSSIDVLIAYLPLYGEANGLSVGLVGALLSVRAGASLVSRLFMGYTLRVLGRRKLLAAGLILAGIGMFGLATAPALPWLLVVMTAMFGLGVGIGQPITIGWVADESPRTERATALGLRLMGNRLALLTVPMVMGVIAGAAGIGVTFGAIAVVLTGGAVTALTTSFARRDERADDAGEPER